MVFSAGILLVALLWITQGFGLNVGRSEKLNEVFEPTTGESFPVENHEAIVDSFKLFDQLQDLEETLRFEQELEEQLEEKINSDSKNVTWTQSVNNNTQEGDKSKIKEHNATNPEIQTRRNGRYCGCPLRKINRGDDIRSVRQANTTNKPTMKPNVSDGQNNFGNLFEGLFAALLNFIKCLSAPSPATTEKPENATGMRE